MMRSIIPGWLLIEIDLKNDLTIDLFYGKKRRMEVLAMAENKNDYFVNSGNHDFEWSEEKQKKIDKMVDDLIKELDEEDKNKK